MLLRTFYRQNTDTYLESIFSIPDEVEKRLFRSICTLAFEKTLTSKQVLEQKEVDLYCEKMNTNSSLGLLTVDRKATTCGFQNMYTFCHLTLQEFLAACHIHLSSDANQLSLIEMCKEKQHMTVVLKFFCGLADFEMDNGHNFKTIIKSPHLNCLDKIQCAYESKQPTTCQYVVESSTLSITENFLTTRDWTCIGFVIVNSLNHPVKKLELKFSGITEEGTNSFSKILEISSTLERLRILGSFNDLPLKFLNTLHFLKILSVTKDQSTEYWMKCFTELVHPNLSVIHFFQNKISKLAVKLDSSVVLDALSSSENIRIECILEKSFKSGSSFFTKEWKSLFNEICASNKCIKLSCTDVKTVGKTVMVIESGDNRILRDIENISKHFFSNYKERRLTSVGLFYSSDLFVLPDQIILVFTPIFQAEAKIEIYILPKDFVIEKFVLNRRSSQSINNIFVKSIQEGGKSGTSSEALELQNEHVRRLCITTDDTDLHQKLREITPFIQQVKQLHITCNAFNSNIAKTHIEDMRLNTFSLQMEELSSVIVVGALNIFSNSMKLFLNKLRHQDLHSLDISHCILSGVIDSSLVPALKAWTNLIELNLKSCSISGKDMAYLVEGIKMSSSLSTLDLSDNYIGNEGCQALSLVLRHDGVTENSSIPHLRNLSLRRCHIDVEGVKFIATAIPKNFYLEILDLRGNNCRNKGIPSLRITALKSCENLTVLD